MMDGQTAMILQDPSKDGGPKKKDSHNVLTKKLSDSATSSKTYWSILNTFHNGKKVPLINTFHNGKKVPLIPPLLIENNLEADYF